MNTHTRASLMRLQNRYSYITKLYDTIIYLLHAFPHKLLARRQSDECRSSKNKIPSLSPPMLGLLFSSLTPLLHKNNDYFAIFCIRESPTMGRIIKLQDLRHLNSLLLLGPCNY
jgi:hypothetical protein